MSITKICRWKFLCLCGRCLRRRSRAGRSSPFFKTQTRMQAATKHPHVTNQMRLMKITTKSTNSIARISPLARTVDLSPLESPGNKLRNKSFGNGNKNLIYLDTDLSCGLSTEQCHLLSNWKWTWTSAGQLLRTNVVWQWKYHEELLTDKPDRWPAYRHSWPESIWVDTLFKCGLYSTECCH